MTVLVVERGVDADADADVDIDAVSNYIARSALEMELAEARAANVRGEAHVREGLLSVKRKVIGVASREFTERGIAWRGHREDV